MGRFSELAFTPAVKHLQTLNGSRSAYARMAAANGERDSLGPDERGFLSERDSFYLASVGEGGWPYIQHRGGPKGFVKVLDAHTLAFADFRGNKQFISTGNVAGSDRVALIFVDYPHQARLKVLAHANLVTREQDPALLEKVSLPGYSAKVERAWKLDVEGFDWNCPQHITPRFTEAEVEQAVKPLVDRVDALEAENRALKAQLRGKTG